MRVVIVGAGEVGYHVAGALYREGVDIVAIDTNPTVLEHLRQEFTLTTILGNAVDSEILANAGLDKADLFLAVTNFDETNIIACLIAGQAGVATTVARVKTMDFGQEASFSDRKNLGIDLIINPYEVAAEHLANLVATPQVTDYTQFLSDRLLLLRINIGEGSPLAGRSVLDFGQQAQIPQTLIALIQRNGNTFIPAAKETVRVGDNVYFFVERGQVTRLFGYLGLSRRPARRVFINGGGLIGFALAKRLEKMNLDVRILEISETRCLQLSQHLDKALILHGDGCDSRVLRAEGVGRADMFISLTAQDHINIVSCMLAKECGTKQAVALVKQQELINAVAARTAIEVAFSPRLLTARKILRFVRGRNLDSFFTFPNSDIELLELTIRPGMPCEMGPLASLELPSGVLVGAVRRGDLIFVPRGQDHLMGGDTILLLQQRRNRRISRSFFLDAEGTARSSPAGATTATA